MLKEKSRYEKLDTADRSKSVPVSSMSAENRGNELHNIVMWYPSAFFMFLSSFVKYILKQLKEI